MIENTASRTTDSNAMKSLCRSEKGKVNPVGRQGFGGTAGRAFPKMQYLSYILNNEGRLATLARGRWRRAFQALGRSEAKAQIHEISRILH